MNGPILIFGLPHSGTTWIGKLFDSHPDTLYRHEPDSVYRLAIPLFPDKSEALRYQQELEKHVATLPGMRSAKLRVSSRWFPKTIIQSLRDLHTVTVLRLPYTPAVSSWICLMQQFNGSKLPAIQQ